MRIGTIIYIHSQQSIDRAKSRYAFLKENGFDCLHFVWNDPDLYTENNAKTLRALSLEYDMPVVNFTPAMGGVMLWDIEHGPATNGLLPAAYRKERIGNILNASRFLELLGADTLSAHIGYLPINRFDPDYIALIQAMKCIMPILRSRGQRFLIETGQEAPILLKRALTDVGEENLLVNFDPGNIIMSGLGTPLCALDTLRGYIAGFHAKDGLIGRDVRENEIETLIGEGDAEFEKVLDKLFHEMHYTGDIIIEREVSPDRRDADIIAELAYLNRYFKRRGKQNE